MDTISIFKLVLKRIYLEELGKHILHGMRRLQRRVLLVDKKLLQRYLTRESVHKLHIGCGDRRLDGWLNSDFMPPTRDIFQLDATRVFPFPDSSFHFVYSEHMIEHISYTAGENMLAECYRVLKAGGRLRIATPNLAFLIQLYGDHKSSLQEDYVAWAQQSFVPFPTNCPDAFVINNFVRAWDHQFIYDEGALIEAIQNAGFHSVRAYPVNCSDTIELEGLEGERNLPPGFYRLETMVLEAQK
jgi:predicted SAM-dependent methyltransferase